MILKEQFKIQIKRINKRNCIKKEISKIDINKILFKINRLFSWCYS